MRSTGSRHNAECQKSIQQIKNSIQKINHIYRKSKINYAYTKRSKGGEEAQGALKLPRDYNADK